MLAAGLVRRAAWYFFAGFPALVTQLVAGLCAGGALQDSDRPGRVQRWQRDAVANGRLGGVDPPGREPTVCLRVGDFPLLLQGGVLQDHGLTSVRLAVSWATN